MKTIAPLFQLPRLFDLTGGVVATVEDLNLAIPPNNTCNAGGGRENNCVSGGGYDNMCGNGSD